MARLHQMTANGIVFSARTGDVILDSALLHGIEFPHDCRVGQCGSCLARVRNGVTLGGNAANAGMIHACQARALSDLELEFDQLPPIEVVEGTVASLVRRSVNVMEVGIKLPKPLAYRPGQYCSFKFKGFPARRYSPTLPADGSDRKHDLTLHIKEVRGGRVSTAFGGAIEVGHKVKVEGPFGSAYYRRDGEERLILIASGTGFAPILSILMAALEDPHQKPILLVVGARNLRSLYMASALIDINRHPNIELIVATSEAPEFSVLKHGTPADFMPVVQSSDGIYVAGSPALVAEIGALAAAVRANFYADAFEPASASSNSWLERSLDWSRRWSAPDVMAAISIR